MIKKNFLVIFILFVSLCFVVFISGGCGGGGGDSDFENNKNNPQENIQYEEGAIQNILNSAVSAVTLGYQGGNNSRYVTEDIELPNSSEGINLSWNSNNSGIISNNGKVSRPTGSNTDVTLTVFAESMDFVASRDFAVTVIKKRARTIEQAKLEIEPVEFLEIENTNINDDFFQIKYSESGDQVRVINGQFTNISVDNADDAQDAIWSIRETIGIEDPYEELELFNVAQNVPLQNNVSDELQSSALTSNGNSYSFRQVYKINGKKIPVYGRTLTVSTNGLGHTSYLCSDPLTTSRLKSSVHDSNIIDELSAAMFALENYPEGCFADTSSASLMIYSIGKSYEQKPVVAYSIRVIGADENDYGVNDTVIVDAVTGETIAAYENEFCAMTMKGKDELKNDVTFPVTPEYENGKMTKLLMKSESPRISVFRRTIKQPAYVVANASAWTLNEEVSAYTNMIKIIQWWKDKFDRNSLDNNGMEVKVIVDESVLGFQTFKDNAAYAKIGEERAIHIGIKVNNPYTDGAFTDVLTHESTHGVIEFDTGGMSKKIALAINEGYADVFGCIIDKEWELGRQLNEDGTIITVNQVRDAAEDVTVESLSLNLSSKSDDYKDFKQSKSIEDLYKAYENTDPKRGDIDSDVAHEYCRLISHAAYLMHNDGAEKIDRSSYGLSWDELGNVWYKSINGLNETSNFHTVRDNVIVAARKYNLSMQKIITIRKAFDAVGITDSKETVLKGKITDFYGNPISEGAVILINSAFTDNQDVNAYTDSNGNFTLPAEPGNYNVTIKALNGNYNVEKFRQVIQDGQETYINKKLTKSGTGTLEITARNDSKNLLSGVQFSLINSANQQISRGFTSINGKCTLYEVPAGSYKLLAVKSGYPEQNFNVTVFANTVNSVEKIINGIGTLSITAKYSSGNTAPGTYVYVMPGTNNNDTTQKIAFSFTNISGKLTFSKIPAGEYTLLVKKNGYPLQSINTTVKTNSTKTEAITLEK